MNMLLASPVPCNGHAFTPPAPDTEAGTIWSFSLADGWTRVPDPVPADAAGDVDDIMMKAGYWCATRYGTEVASFSAALYTRDDEAPDDADTDATRPAYLVLVDIPGDGRFVAVPNLPSLIRLLGDLLPLVTHAAESDRQEKVYEKQRQETRRRAELRRQQRGA